MNQLYTIYNPEIMIIMPAIHLMRLVSSLIIIIIKALYCNYSTRVLSPPFQQLRSTRQGGPASPLIFRLAPEPPAWTIRDYQSVAGIHVYGYDFKISLNADDILITLANPGDPIPRPLKLINDLAISLVTRLIGLTKSEAILLNHLTVPDHLTSTPKTKDVIQYLGIRIKSPKVKRS